MGKKITRPMTQEEITYLLEKAVRGDRLKVFCADFSPPVVQPIIRKDEIPEDGSRVISIRLLFNYVIFFNSRNPYAWVCAHKEQGLRYVVRVKILK